MKRLFIILALFSLISCDGGNKPSEDEEFVSAYNPAEVSITEIIAAGKVEPSLEIIDLAASSDGIVSAILKQEGDSVKRGEALVMLDDELDRLKIEKIKSQIISQQTLVKLEELAMAETELKLHNRSSYLASVRLLAEKGAETRQYLEDLETEVKTLRMASERGLESVRLARSRNDELELELSLTRAETEKKILRAPFDGILLDMFSNQGSALNRYEAYARIAPAGGNIIRAEVDELFSDRIMNGQTAEIRYYGSESKIAGGKVVFVSPYLKKKSLFSGESGEQEDRLVREIRIMLHEETSLVLNSRVECIIYL